MDIEVSFIDEYNRLTQCGEGITQQFWQLAKIIGPAAREIDIYLDKNNEPLLIIKTSDRKYEGIVFGQTLRKARPDDDDIVNPTQIEAVRPIVEELARSYVNTRAEGLMAFVR